MQYKILALMLTFLMTACSSTKISKFPDISKMIPQISEDTRVVNNHAPPEWTLIESGVYRESTGKAVFYGLGRSGDKDNSKDKKTLSEDRARDELAIVLASYIERLAVEVSKIDFNSEVISAKKDRLNGSLEKDLSTILMEVEIVNHYENVNNGEVYSMAKLDLNRLKEKLDGSRSISIEDKSFLKEAISHAHDSMANGAVIQVSLKEENIDLQPKHDRRVSY